MAAIVTDQFRISNASNFIDSVGDTSANSFYIILSLPNPTAAGFGRKNDWDTNTPNPILTETIETYEIPEASPSS